MAKPNKKEFEKGLQESGYVLRKGSHIRLRGDKGFSQTYWFERYFGRYSVDINTFSDDSWSFEGNCELQPNIETSVVKWEYKTFDINTVRKAEAKFARYVRDNFIPFIQSACILPKGLEALLKK